jgi:LPXTG-motif cell wall-anchored protein
MINKTPKTIKYKLRTASQWLLVGLLTTSTALPGIVTTVTASTKEPTVSQAIDTDTDINTNEEMETVEQSVNTEDLEVSDTSEELDDEVGEEKETTAETTQITPEETTSEEITSENNLKAEDDIGSGNWGDTPWRIDSDFTLHIGGGHLGLLSFSSYAPDYYLEVKKIVFDEEVRVNGDSNGALFAGMKSVVEIENLSNLDTSDMKSMSSMFANMSSLTSLDVSNFDTTSMPYMYKPFYGTYKLSELTLGKNFDFGEDADLPEHLESDTYTGRWINVGTGSLEAPEGKNIWSSSELMTNYNGDMDADTYIWQRQPVAGKDVTVKYEDESGKSIADEETLQGKVGEDYNSVQKDIEGYTFKEVKDDNASGKFTDQAQTVIYVYTKNPVSEEDLSHITVHDSDLKVGDNWTPEDNFDEATDFEGKVEKFSDIIVEGSVDTKKAGTYEVTYSIPEEHWSKSSSVEGVHSATAKIVVSEEDTETDGSGSESNNSGNNTGSSDKDSSTDNGVLLTNVQNNQEQIKQKNQILPQTGEHFSAIAFMAGLSLLVLGSLFAVLRFKKNK